MGGTTAEFDRDRTRVSQLRDRQEATYRTRPPRSAAVHDRALLSPPLGVASTFQPYHPYPLFMSDARGSRISDVDGNDYVDFDSVQHSEEGIDRCLSVFGEFAAELAGSGVVPSSAGPGVGCRVGSSIRSVT